MVRPVGGHVIHRLRVSVLLTVVLSSLAVSQGSDREGSACTFDNELPSKGRALLQHLTTRSNPAENTFPVHRHEQPQKRAMLQTKHKKHRGLPPLPADAKKLFNLKLCGVKPQEKKKQVEEKQTGDTHDYDDPGPDEKDDSGPDDTFPDDQDKPSPKSDIDEAIAASTPSHLVASQPSQDSLESQTHSTRSSMDRSGPSGTREAYDAADVSEDMEESDNANNANDSEEDSEESEKTDAAEPMEDDPPERSMPSLLQTKRSESDDSDTEEDSSDTEEDLWDPEKVESEKAALSQEGFQQVCEKRSEAGMSNFIRRVAESCNMKIIDEGGLNGAVGWFSNPDMDVSFDKLKSEMFKALLAGSADHWVTVKKVSGITASNAPLDMWGFVQVRALRKKKQTVKFVRRMIEDMGIKVTDEDGFDGLMKYYSEPDDSQSFQRMVAEIKKATYEHSWAELD